VGASSEAEQHPSPAAPSAAGGEHAQRRRKHWGWGYEDEQPTSAQLAALARSLEARLQVPFQEPRAPAALEQLRLPAVRLSAPRALAELCTSSHYERARHAHGSSYADVVEGFYGRFAAAPDLVAYPRSEDQVQALLAWCAEERIAAIPYGGGTSVVGGVRPQLPAGYAGALCIDLSRLSGLYELDTVSAAARLGAGSSGPQLEAALGRSGFTLRHYPQSFALSTLGGWIATRAAGHFATGQTHIEDQLEALRMATPAGMVATTRLPASGAGIDPLRLMAGSEGALGVITEAWVRVRRRPRTIVRATVSFERFELGAHCIAALLQEDLQPANCRLLDEHEAALALAEGERRALLLLAFESPAGAQVARGALAAAMDRALAICAQHGGALRGEARFQERSQPSADAGAGAREAGEAGWREAFLGAPYLRDAMVACGVFTETFETAVTWERLAALDNEVRGAALRVLEGRGVRERDLRLSARLTHAYRDGAAPYYTVIAPVARGEEHTLWQELKSAISEAILAAGGTITHHHAVGRDHMPWYGRERPEPFAAAIAGAKSALDPRWVMNPGVLLKVPPLS